jgi:hypothetical protein
MALSDEQMTEIIARVLTVVARKMGGTITVTNNDMLMEEQTVLEVNRNEHGATVRIVDLPPPEAGSPVKHDA